jgi:hypothetical protein
MSKTKARAHTGNKGDTVKASKGRREWKAIFLDAFRNSANVRAACESARISRKTAYAERKTDAEFAEAWDEAECDAVDLLETKAWKRSDASDTILMFLLRAHRPEKFSERTRNEVTGKGGAPLFPATVNIFIPDNGRGDSSEGHSTASGTANAVPVELG